jgi:hypothetical protein
MVVIPKGFGPEKVHWQGPAAYTKDTHPLVREDAPRQQDCNCHRVINGARNQDLLIDWSSVAMWLWFDKTVRWGSTPRLTDSLTVSRHVILTLIWQNGITAVGVPCGTKCSNTSFLLLIYPNIINPTNSGRANIHVGSLESETVKYGHESRGIRTQEWLLWRGPAAIVKGRPFSRQRERPISTNPQLSDTKKNLVVSPRWVIDTKTDWPTDRRS